MSAYVLLAGTNDEDAAPTVLGPFINHDTAAAYADSPQVMAWITHTRQIDGGYPMAYVISERTVGDPIAWMNDWSDDDGDILMEGRVPPRRKKSVDELRSTLWANKEPRQL